MPMQNPREVYGRTLVELGKENPNIVVLEADLGKSTMSCYFEQAFPERFFEMGIAEANMTSFAAGLALTGKIPFTNSFAVFAAGRAYDQIRQGICIPGLNVKIVGSSAGLSDFGDGSTHQSVEDLAIMRAIPNMTVLVPADGNETRKMTRAIARYKGPVYMRAQRFARRSSRRSAIRDRQALCGSRWQGHSGLCPRPDGLQSHGSRRCPCDKRHFCAHRER